MIIRHAAIEDAAAMLAVYAPYVEHTAISFEYEPPTLDEFRQRIEHVTRRYPWLVAEDDGRIIGYAYASAFHNDRAAYHWSAEASIYLDTTCRHKGVGRQLQEALETELRRQGIKNIYASIAYSETEDELLTHDSIHFHERQGFTKVAHFHRCGRKFDRCYDIVWMEKLL